MKYNLLIPIILYVGSLQAQCLTLGADLSYVNTILENNGVYRDETGSIVEPYQFFAEKGNEMVRFRLWHTPSNITNYCGEPITASSLADVLKGAKKAADNNMEVMIAFHYGDYFNDPGKQPMPAAWMGLSHEVLLDSIYQYTYFVLQKLKNQNTPPAVVGIGNETTWGFIDDTQTTNGWSWPKDADKFNIAIKAVNDFNADHNLSIKKAVHFTEKSAVWLAQIFTEHQITDIDIFGISFYPYFSHDTDFDELGSIISELKNTYGKEVMIFETGFVWKKSGGADSYGNIFNNNGNVFYYPATPDGQKQFMEGLCQAVLNNGGSGIIYWEPGYISSDACTKWGQGSPYENVCFFDYTNENRALPVFDYYQFCDDIEQENGNPVITIAYPNPNQTNDLTIESDKALNKWSLFDLSGRLMAVGTLNFTEKRHTLVLSPVLNGLYIVTLEDIIGNKESLKILIQ